MSFAMDRQEAATIRERETCSICFEALISELEMLPCKHLFHQTCINEWRDAQGRDDAACPLCRDAPTEEETRIIR